MEFFKLGIDIGGTKIAYGLFNQDKELVYRYKSATDPNTSIDKFIQDVLRDIHSILEVNHLTKENLKGIGMGFPSYVNFEKGIVVCTSNMRNIHHFNAKNIFHIYFPNTQIIVDNDTNLAALAEHRYGAGKGLKNFLYTAISTGLGSGLIINNQIYRGDYGGAGESGHMIINPGNGILCGCENQGCFMSYTSGSMIVEHVKNEIQKGKETIMSDMVNGNLEKITAEHLNLAFQQGDPLAEEMLDQIGHYLGIYIYNIFMCLNFKTYVFGGGMTYFGPPLFDRIKNTFHRYNHQKDQEIQIKIAELGEDFGIIGAAEILD
ncbi:MAG: ROK family protein [Eubacteriales bacterium]